MKDSDKLFIKELMNKTGLGMLDCKRVFIECDKDMEKSLNKLEDIKNHRDTLPFQTKR